MVALVSSIAHGHYYLKIESCACCQNILASVVLPMIIVLQFSSLWPGQATHSLLANGSLACHQDLLTMKFVSTTKVRAKRTTASGSVAVMHASSSGTRCACMLQPLILAKANLSCFESCPSCRGVCHDTVPQAYRKAHPRRSAGRGSQCTCPIVGKDAGWHNGHQGSNAKRCAVVAGTHGRHAKAFPSRLAQHESKASHTNSSDSSTR